jgi:hypothetical protein
MAWGGARVGAGRKPKRDPEFQVLDGRAAFSSGPDLTKPPADLAEAHQQVWRDWAPRAIDQLTLVVATVPAFLRLCDLEVKRQAADKKATEGGVSELRIYLQLVKQIEGLMARFRLAPVGKAMAKATRASAPNPTERFLSALSGRK